MAVEAKSEDAFTIIAGLEKQLASQAGTIKALTQSAKEHDEAS